MTQGSALCILNFEWLNLKKYESNNGYIILVTTEQKEDILRSYLPKQLDIYILYYQELGSYDVEVKLRKFLHSLKGFKPTQQYCFSNGSEMSHLYFIDYDYLMNRLITEVGPLAEYKAKKEEILNEVILV